MTTLDSPRTASQRVDRWSLGIFVVVVVLAVPLLLYLGRDQWFGLDGWWLLSDGADSHDGILDAHNGHWITLRSSMDARTAFCPCRRPARPSASLRACSVEPSPRSPGVT